MGWRNPRPEKDRNGSCHTKGDSGAPAVVPLDFPSPPPGPLWVRDPDGGVSFVVVAAPGHDHRGDIMSDWFCQACGNWIRGRIQVPAYCPRCGLKQFLRTGRPTTPQAAGTAGFPAAFSSPAPASETPLPPPTPDPTVPGPHGDRRSARRVQPKEPLEVRFSWHGPLRALDISATGLLVEHSTPFAPGAIFDVHLCRAGKRIRLRGQVVRSSGAADDGRRPPVIRYRTGVQFLETPQTFFAFLPELSGPAQSSSPSPSA